MSILIFLLVMLVMIDHVLKYRPERLVFYKNNHRYSVIIALLEEPPHLDEFIDMTQKNPHEFVFVNVNQAVDATFYPEVTMVDLDVDASTHPSSVPVLHQAYLAGYKKATNQFLLFMNGALRFNETKFLTHMANNLVEHQLYTVKEALPERDAKEGFKLFFDLFDDMESTADKVNFNFFSIKRETFELAGCHEYVLDSAETFEHLLQLRNINILYIAHNNTVKRVERHKTFKPYIHEWFTLYNHKATHGGLKRMALFLLAFHLFYLFVVLDFRVVVLVFVPLIHFAFYLVTVRRAHHKTLSFVLIPFYMLFFDVVLLVGIFKRILHRKRQSKSNVSS
ncbi:MAG: hypothetical protein ACOCU5_00595 [Bacillota bacterium]